MKVFLNPGHAPGGHPDPGAEALQQGLKLYRKSMLAVAVILALLAATALI